MNDLLVEIQCVQSPGDILEFETISGVPYVSVIMISGQQPCVALDRESATKLRDALTDWLDKALDNL